MNTSLGNERTLLPGPAAASDMRDQLVERFRRSGLTQEAFARAHQLPVSRLRSWLYRRRPARAARSPRWQEIRLSPSSVTRAWAAEVGLPDGRTIRLEGTLARELIPALLAGL
jgi:hypothetical protein